MYRTPPRKSKKVLWALLLIPGAIISLVLLVVVGGFLFMATGTEEPVTGEDRAVLVDINLVAEWMEDYVPERRGEKVTKTRYIDGSYDIDYEYDIPDTEDAPYLNCTVTVETTRSDALVSYDMLWAGEKLGLSMFSDIEIDVVERNDLFRWGDHSRFAILQSGGEPFGNLLITRKGRHIFYLLLSGVYFEDRDAIGGLMHRPLSQLPAYSP